MLAGAHRPLSDRPTADAAPMQDPDRADRRSGGVPRLRAAARRAAAPAGGKRAEIPEPAARHARPLARRHRRHRRHSLSDRRLDRPRRSRRHLALAPIPVPRRDVRSRFRDLLPRWPRRPRGEAWPAPCGQRVLRGGSWNNNPRNLRSANRNRNTTDNRNNNNGFRVASTHRCLSRAVHGRRGRASVRPGPAMMSRLRPLRASARIGARLALVQTRGRVPLRFFRSRASARFTAPRDAARWRRKTLARIAPPEPRRGPLRRRAGGRHRQWPVLRRRQTTGTRKVRGDGAAGRVARRGGRRTPRLPRTPKA
ncbi:MAG: hypothetical protein FJ311_16080 [Rhodospirillales bacterium]|nr:hypothetical protein [Rhodospirillales bacterium]